MHTTLISCTDLQNQLPHQPTNPFAIIDCRFWLADTEKGRRDYVESHIPGAVYAHLDEDLSGPVTAGLTGRHPLPDPEKLARTFGGWGIGPGVQVVVYDDAGGSIAARLWWLLRWLGHEAVALLDGGWQAWLAAGGPTTGGWETRTPPHSPPVCSRAGCSPPRRWRRSAEKQPGGCSMRASADRFRGENETIDPVAGHIPGALSAPWQENLAADGRFLAPAQLAAHYRALLGAAARPRPRPIVVPASPPATPCWP